MPSSLCHSNEYGVRCTGQDQDSPEDLEDLVNLRVAGEEWLARAHLGEDRAYGPHVDSGGVLASTEQDFWRAIPQSDYL